MNETPPLLYEKSPLDIVNCFPRWNLEADFQNEQGGDRLFIKMSNCPLPACYWEEIVPHPLCIPPTTQPDTLRHDGGDLIDPQKLF